MKLKDGFIITKNGNDYIAVAAGEAGKAFNGMIKMNGTAALSPHFSQRATPQPKR